MKNNIEIRLNQGAEFVKSGDIPRMIADVLHPLPDYGQFPVTGLEKRYWGDYVKSKWKFFWFTLTPYRAPTIKVLTEEDRAILAQLWAHLPKLEYPILWPALRPYINAFSMQKEYAIDWELAWDGGGTPPQSVVDNCKTECAHLVLIADAIELLQLNQLDYVTLAPTNAFHPFGLVRVEDFSSYANKFKIDVIVEKESQTIAEVGTGVLSGSHSKVDRESPEAKPWLVPNPADPKPEVDWYIPARFFARQLVIEESTLLHKRVLLARKTSKSMADVGIFKRGGKLAFDESTVLKAFVNVKFG